MIKIGYHNILCHNTCIIAKHAVTHFMSENDHCSNPHGSIHKHDTCPRISQCSYEKFWKNKIILYGLKSFLLGLELKDQITLELKTIVFPHSSYGKVQGVMFKVKVTLFNLYPGDRCYFF